HRARVGGGNSGAREIDRRVERVPPEREAIAVLGAARELDHHFADADDAGFFGHGSPDLWSMKHGAVEKANAPPPGFSQGAGCPSSGSTPQHVRGAGRRQALMRIRRTPWSISRADRSPDRR